MTLTEMAYLRFVESNARLVEFSRPDKSALFLKGLAVTTLPESALLGQRSGVMRGEDARSDENAIRKVREMAYSIDGKTIGGFLDALEGAGNPSPEWQTEENRIFLRVRLDEVLSCEFRLTPDGLRVEWRGASLGGRTLDRLEFERLLTARLTESRPDSWLQVPENNNN